jgi:gamma-glutamylcyclotransferase (GGCT)/AIG2-like uncharacterized protein YtfP
VDANFNYQNNYLFVYGTLLDDANEFGAYLKKNLQFFAEGKFNGLLYDIGKYPGAIYHPGGDAYVYGSVLILNDVEKDLTLLDAYEGFGEHEEQPNLFVRELIAVDIGQELLTCWVYLYNRPVEDNIRIVSGRYFG